jgi:Spy/CpxP family protein refolding chaperone
MSKRISINGMLLVGGLLLGSMAPVSVLAQSGSQDSGQSQTAPAQSNAQEKAKRPKLNLTEEQKAQAKKIHEDARSQMAAVKNDGSLSADQKQAKMREIRHDAHKQFTAMLTPEQKKTMKEWRHERKAEHQQKQQPS